MFASVAVRVAVLIPPDTTVLFTARLSKLPFVDVIPDALIVPAVMFWATVRLFSPPRFVMFASVAVSVLVVTVFATTSVPLNLPPLIVPLTLISLKLPAVAVSVAALIASAVIVPVTLKPWRPDRFVMFASVAVSVAVLIPPDTTVLFTARLSKLPFVDVMPDALIVPAVMFWATVRF